jgi:hypothetical protein
MATANMGLTLPDVSVTPGPTWASQINSDLSLIDAHNHTPGFGTQIPVAGLNINGDLPFGNNAATGLSYLQLNPQAAPSATSSLYADENGNFFYRNSLGGIVQITSGGGIAATPGSIGGLPSGTAAVTFSPTGGKYTFTKATNQAAVVDHGPLVLRTGASGSNAVAITPATGTQNYALTLPASLPGNPNLLMGCSTLGAMSFLATDSTLSLTSSLLKVAPLGITVAQIAVDAVETDKIKNQAVTPLKMQTKTIASSNDVAFASTGNISPTNAFGANCFFLALAGKPICVEVLSTGGTNTDSSIISVGDDVYAYIYASTPTNPVGSRIASVLVRNNDTSPVTVLKQIIANPDAGTYTFRVQFNVAGNVGGAEVQMTNFKLVAYLV